MLTNQSKGRNENLKFSIPKCYLLSGPRCPEGSGKLRFPDYMTMAWNGGKVASLKHRPPLPPGKYSWYSFLLEAESNPRP